MNERTISPWWTGLLVLMLGVALAACDSQNAADEGSDDVAQQVAELTSELTQDLNLSGAQQQAVQGVMNRHERRMREPGFLWFVAADLQATLTDEQKDSLFARAEQQPNGFRHFGIFGEPGCFQADRDRFRDRQGGFFDDLLTDEQRAALTEIRERFSAQIQALLEARRNGDLTPEDFHTQVEALREAMRAEIEALLTDEQRAEIERRREERRITCAAETEDAAAAVRAAMIEALGLNDEQIAALDALLEQQKAEREALFEQFRADQLTREELQEAVTALDAASDAALHDILNETQWEIKLIHDALAFRLGRIAERHHGPGWDGGFGGPPGGGRRGGSNG